MKRIFCLALSLILLLCGCAVPPVETSVQTTAPTTVPATTEATEPAPEPTVYFPDTLVSTEAYSEPADPDARLAYRRDLVEAEMRRMMSLLWTPAEDIVYIHNEKPVTLKAGRVYRGMPYSHGSGSGLGFMTFASEQDEDGVYTLSGLNGDMMTGQVDLARVSNDCADAVFWAWSKVATSISFPYTNRMTKITGCLPVGSYFHNRLKYDGSTKPICTDNGTDVMYDSYAQLQKGDAMVLYTDKSGGHAVMVTDVHVVKNADGKIDGNKSYVVILEQISSNLNDNIYEFNPTIGKNVYLCGGVDTKWTFSHIFKKGYLPVTCKELIDPAPVAAETLTDTVSEFTAESILSGALTSNYPIASVTITITDNKGNVVQRATAFTPESSRYTFRIRIFSNPLEQNLINGSITPDTLTPGSYHCTLACSISTGRTYVVRDYDFTV